MSFDWQTEENNWEEASPPAPAEEPRRSGLRLVPFVLLALALVIAGALTIWRQFDNRLEDVVADIEADVLASSRLVRLAADRRDGELFITVLSGRDPYWAGVHQELLSSGMLLDRTPLGLRVQTQQEPEVIELTLSPDLTEAVVVANEHYAIDVGNGITDTVLLQRRDIYRLGPAQWLLAPPLEDESGAWVVSEGRFLTLIFPEAESELAQRLSRDLDHKIAELCVVIAEMRCGNDFHLTVRLDTDPASLQLGSLLESVSDVATVIWLPAPSLVGVPTDEESYEALFRGYAVRIAGPALLSALGWECCEHTPIAAAVQEQVLADLALLPRRQTEAAHDHMLSNMRKLRGLFTMWDAQESSPAEGDVEAAASVASFMLAQNPDSSIGRLVTTLADQPDFWEWIRRNVPPAMSDSDIERAWLDFVWQGTTFAERPLPIALPEQDVLLLCTADSRSSAGTLYRYSPKTGFWTPEVEDRRFVSMTPLPNGSGVALLEASERSTTSPWIVLSRWQGEGLETLWDSGQVALLYFYDLVDPEGKWLYLVAGDLDIGRNFVQGISLEACASEDGCSPEVRDGITLFAPDNRHGLTLQPGVNAGEQSTIHLTDPAGNTLRVIDAAVWPFWVDSEQFGYVRLDGAGNGVEIQLMRLDDEEPRVLLTAEEALEAAPDLPERTPVGNEELRVEGLAVNGERLYFAVGRESSPWDDLLQVDLETGRVGYVLETLTGRDNVPLLQFSPDGKWLQVIGTTRVPGGSGEILLHDVEASKTIRLSLLDIPYGMAWSADGNWLAKADGDWLTLIAPEYDYQRVVAHDNGPCGPAGWVEPSADG